ncbi:hypothetical protein VNO77_24445 [Canavalia gladiata]|uniref:Uncharacterized protein n=1 Tax=Canavalia gladiata TaxID=3824 RepID=A0AAN9QCM3_CANGL
MVEGGLRYIGDKISCIKEECDNHPSPNLSLSLSCPSPLNLRQSVGSAAKSVRFLSSNGPLIWAIDGSFGPGVNILTQLQDIFEDPTYPHQRLVILGHN